MFATGLSKSTNKPLVSVNHLAGHALSPRLSEYTLNNPELDFPYLVLLASGGHCQFLEVLGPSKFIRLGGTIDDSPGEAFDKVSRLLGLGYPGGPIIEKLASKEKNSNFQIINIKQNSNLSIFDIKINIPSKKKIIKNIKLPMIGFHNITNATAAVALAFTIGLPEKFIKLGLFNFKGVQRRFTHLFDYKKVSFYDDYAHHPTEISSVLNGVRSVYKNKEIICIFQPHRISRVINLRKEFSRCFEKADTVILCPIYTANEKAKLPFTYNSFAKLIIKNSKIKLIQVENEKQLKKFIKQSAFGNKIYIGMGAGSISNWMRGLKSIF